MGGNRWLACEIPYQIPKWLELRGRNGPKEHRGITANRLGIVS